MRRVVRFLIWPLLALLVLFPVAMALGAVPRAPVARQHLPMVQTGTLLADPVFQGGVITLGLEADQLVGQQVVTLSAPFATPPIVVGAPNQTTLANDDDFTWSAQAIDAQTIVFEIRTRRAQPFGRTVDLQWLAIGG